MGRILGQALVLLAVTIITVNAFTSIGSISKGRGDIGRRRCMTRNDICTRASTPVHMSVSRRELIAGALPAVVGLILGGNVNTASAIPPPSATANSGVKTRFGDKLRRVAKILDELQQDIFNEDWDIVGSYPATFRALVPVFTRYTDAAFPGDDPSDKNSRVALRYEVGRFFGGVERLRRATDNKDVKEAEGAFASLSVAYDRYLKAGDLYTAYDPVTSTEKYYKGVSNSDLVFVPPSRDPPKIRDNIMLIFGPDKGRTGQMIGQEVTSVTKAIIKLDNTLGGIREIKVVPYEMVAKTAA